MFCVSSKSKQISKSTFFELTEVPSLLLILLIRLPHQLSLTQDQPWCNHKNNQAHKQTSALAQPSNQQNSVIAIKHTCKISHFLLKMDTTVSASSKVSKGTRSIFIFLNCFILNCLLMKFQRAIHHKGIASSPWRGLATD